MAPVARPTPSELSEILLKELEAHPEGAKIKECIQCGTCSASCPTASAMDYTPRQVIALFRAGMLDKALTSNTIWLCASCYNCTVRCPAGIKFTDLMYELKRLGMKYEMYPADDKTHVLSETFVELVDKYGRNPEFALMRNFYLRADPLAALKNAMFAFNMWRKGRLKLGANRVKDIEALRKIRQAASSEEAR